MNIYLSMAAFSLAASISPGPVNIVSLSCGAQHGFTASMRHVSGATFGFTALLLFIGMGLYAANGDTRLIWQFTLIYFAICYLSMACWAYAGSFLRHYLRQAKHMRAFNRLMAVLLAGSVLYLL
jgi:threonine/homoserine/homoserine lactone efflux protein